MDISLKIVYTFNKLYGNFLRDIKGVNDDIKKRVKANYKVIVKNSPEYLVFFWNNVCQHETNIDPTNNELLDMEVFKDIKLCDIITNLGQSNVVMVWNYVYILSALSMIYEGGSENLEGGVKEEIDVDDEVPELIDEEAETIEDADSKQVLFDKVVKVFGAALRGEDTSSDLNDIIDDDLRAVLGKLTQVPVSAAPEVEEKDDIMNMFSSLENSKICNLAKEISKDIDISNLKIENPQDIMKMMDFSSGNNMLGNIIGKVSNKIQEKISTGEIKHEDLLGEAMSMMGMMQKSGAASGLFNNPMMAELMKGMKKGKAVPRTDVLNKQSTREKLRKKLEERQQQQKK